MLKSFFACMCLLLTCQFVVSCRDNEPIDGDWEAMKWKTDNMVGNVNIQEKSNALTTFIVSGEGAVDVVCQNYSGFWMSDANYPKDWKGFDEYQYEWLKISIEGNIAHCVFSNVAEDFHKELFITLTAGDIFYSFHFVRVEDFGISGKWAPVKWNLAILEGDVEMETYDYSANFYVDGRCSFDLVCENYSELWFEPGIFTSWPLEDRYNVEAYWCHLNIKGNTVHCNIDAWNNHENDAAGIDFEVSAREIFSKLYFYQKSVINNRK